MIFINTRKENFSNLQINLKNLQQKMTANKEGTAKQHVNPAASKVQTIEYVQLAVTESLKEKEEHELKSWIW